MIRVILPAIALGLLTVPSLASACQYIGPFEQAGTASQQFFAQRQAQQAATVDIAVAGETRRAFGSDPRWGIPATTFHVIERIKGTAPDRYTLFVGNEPTNGRGPQFTVDDKGRLSPKPYAEEYDAGQFGPTRTITSCHPGYYTVREGEAYLIFRDAAGRLLHRVELYEGFTRSTFALMPAGLASREGWANSYGLGPGEAGAPTLEISPTTTTLRFRAGTTARQASAFLRQRRLAPFAVRTVTGSFVEETRVPVAVAAAGLIDRAMDDARANRDDDGLAKVAAQVLTQWDADTLEQDSLLRLRAWQLLAATQRRPAKDAPITIREVEVTGSATAIAALRKKPGAVEVIDAPAGSGAWWVAPPDQQAAGEASWRETTDSLLARLRSLAAGDPLPAPVKRLPEPEPEPDPFSYMDCIRFGREEALALADLPKAGQFGEATVFGDPEEVSCKESGSGLNCDVAPDRKVRVSWAGWEGGFAVSPKGARLSFDGEGLQCTAPQR